MESMRVTRAEMEILRFIMEYQPVTVRVVADAMLEQRGLARTTTMTLMERLRKKGVLKRELNDGVNEYSLCESKERVQSMLIQDFVQNAFGGSISPFFAYLIESNRLSEGEAAILSRLAEDLDGA